MGVIYLARDSKTRQNVAVKMLATGIEDESVVLRFQREARSLEKLKHPNIVEFLGVGEEKGTHYIVMEYVEGENIRNFLLKRRENIFKEGIPLLKQVCSALAYAHAQGVIHRDIKPDNILVTPENVAKIIDFGLAKKVQSTTRLTMQNIFLGTMAYVAPEQALDSDLGPGTDIYALGVAMFEIFTDQLPFFADNPTAMLYKMIHEMPPSPRAINDAIPMKLNCLIQAMIEKDLKQRPESADAVAKELDGILYEMRTGKHLKPQVVRDMEPEDAIDPLVEQMELLEEVEARTLIYASTLGMKFELRKLGDMLDIEPEDLPGIVNNLVKQGFLLRHVPTELGIFSFPGEDVRRAVHKLIPESERRYIERRLLPRALEEPPAAERPAHDEPAPAAQREHDVEEPPRGRPAPLAVERILPAGTLLRERYSIDKVLAEGSNSTVYLASDVVVEMAVVIKEIVPAARKAEEMEEFKWELTRLCTILVSLSHKCVPGFLNFFENEGRHYIVMEFVEGSTLERLVRERGGPLSMDEFSRCARQLFDVLEFLHGLPEPFLFMDMKPSHVIMDIRGAVKVIDFGLGRVFNKGNLQANTDTPRGRSAIGFCPVEQYGTGVVSVTSDQYALAAVLYYILTAQAPPEPINRLTMNTPLVPPSHYRPEVPKSVDIALLRALELLPQERFRSIQDFRRSLPGMSDTEVEQAQTADGAKAPSMRKSMSEQDTTEALAEALERARSHLEEQPVIDMDLSDRISAEIASLRKDVRRGGASKAEQKRSAASRVDQKRSGAHRVEGRKSEALLRSATRSTVEKLPEKLTRDTLSGRVLPLNPPKEETFRTIQPSWRLIGAFLGLVCFLDGFIIERLVSLGGVNISLIAFSPGKGLGLLGALAACLALAFIMTILNTYLLNEMDLAPSMHAILFCLAGLFAACLFQIMGRSLLNLIYGLPGNLHLRNFLCCAALSLVFSAFLASAKLAAQIRDRGTFMWLFLLGGGAGLLLYLVTLTGLVKDLTKVPAIFTAGSWGLVMAFLGASLDGWLIEKTELSGPTFSDRGLAAGLTGGALLSCAGLAPLIPVVLGAGTILGGAITLTGRVYTE